MQIFDKGTIEGFSKQVDETIINDSFSRLSTVISKTIEDIRKRNVYINQNYEIIPINEFLIGAVTPNSNLDILLAINSPQLEFNTVKLIKNRFRSIWLRIKDAWRYRPQKHKKKKKNSNQLEKDLIREKNNYSIISFQKDIVNTISNYLSSASYVTLNRGVIRIKGGDFPFKIRIFTVINKLGSYNYYLHDKVKFFNIDLKERNNNIEYLLNEYSEKYLELVRIYHNVYFNIYNQNANPIFIESLIANLPSEIFLSKTAYEMFIFSINYFNNTRLNSLKSITDFNTLIINENLCNTNIVELKKFIDDIVKYTKITL